MRLIPSRSLRLPVTWSAWARTARRAIPLAIVQCVGLLLIGCVLLDTGTDIQPCVGQAPHPLPVAHARYLAPLSTRAVFGIAPYRDTKGMIHAVVAMGGKFLWDLDAGASGDGSLAAIPGTPPEGCLGAPAVTMDGAHLACVQPGSDVDYTCVAGCSGRALLLMQPAAAALPTLVPASSPTPTVWTTDGAEPRSTIRVSQPIRSGVGVVQRFSSAPGRITSFRSPTWSPDGQHLAVLEHDMEGISNASQTLPCALGLYALVPPGKVLAQTARLALPNPSICNAIRLTWSPDGAMLAVLLQDVIELLPISALPRSALGPGVPGSHPLVSTLGDGDLRPLVAVSDARWLDWMPNGQALTVLDAYGMGDISLATKERTARSIGSESTAHSPLPGFGWLPGSAGLVVPVDWTDLAPTPRPTPTSSPGSGAAGATQPRGPIAGALAPLVSANCVRWQAGLYVEDAL